MFVLLHQPRCPSGEEPLVVATGILELHEAEQHEVNLLLSELSHVRCEQVSVLSNRESMVVRGCLIRVVMNTSFSDTLTM